ncbi:MAG TPA: undecaprenyl-diphosphate phosphatase, partial [Trueperaceae bacterium]
ILWFTPKSGPKKTPADLSWKDALVVGTMQGLAVIPGISRSGSTIAAALYRNASAELAPHYSFLLYLVASLGVALLGIGEIREAELELMPLVGMTVAAFVTGYLALTWLFALLRRGRFRWFAPYVWALAGITLLTLWL